MGKIGYKYIILTLIFVMLCSIIEPSFTVYAQAYGRLDEVIEECEADKRRVYLGGQLVGFEVGVNGVMIVDFIEVDTQAGYAKIRSDLQIGDIIKEINGKKVESADNISEILNKDKSNIEVKLLVERGGALLTVTVNPLIDRVSGEFRLGISVKSVISGIGTVTFVKRDGSFGALGHSVSGESYSEAFGKVYGCKILGIEKGVKGRAGAIRGALCKREDLGEVCKNIRYGIYGKLDEVEGELFDIASKSEIKSGNAMICSSVTGKKEHYSVEIIKVNYQNELGEKGLVIRITDERLLKLTGGIVQGMSGSPILQNGKIVGAVTHVMVNDPTRGYGIFIENMINQAS